MSQLFNIRSNKEKDSVKSLLDELYFTLNLYDEKKLAENIFSHSIIESEYLISAFSVGVN